ncbi:MAG: hypothetical protein HY243_09600 [Proteobacteria bacterium]|nr:hypothetical protein [Pseudomonadota bacterium]
MTAKTVKQKSRKNLPAVPIEDDKRHRDQTDTYITRNRDALNDSIRRSREEIAQGKSSSKTIDDIVTAGRRRHTR